MNFNIINLVRMIFCKNKNDQVPIYAYLAQTDNGRKRFFFLRKRDIQSI